MKLIPYNQPTDTPVPKVQAVGVAGIIIPAIVAILAYFGVIVPDNVSQAATNSVAGILTVISMIQTVVMFFAGYFKKDKKPLDVVRAIESTKEGYDMKLKG